MQHAMTRQEHGWRLEHLVGETGRSEFRAGPPVIASVSDVRGTDTETGESVWNAHIHRLKKGVSDEALGGGEGGGGGGVRKNIWVYHFGK